MKVIKITHLTSAHPRYDARIFLKECSFLAKQNNYDVSLIVADGLGDENINNVHIYDVGKSQGRLKRMALTTKKVYEKALILESEVFHFHDPELIPIGLKLKKIGKKVIFDVHEDVPKQLLAKPYGSVWLKKLLSSLYASYEKYAAKKFDYIVTPTPLINERFLQLNRSVELRNFPILEELFIDVPWETRDNRVCHIGSLAESRGVVELVDALHESETVLELAGDFRPKTLLQQVQQMPGWQNAYYHGYASRDQVRSILERVKVGLVTLHPTPSYLEAYPVKLFEYMAAGIAVIASDFPLYRGLLKSYPCVVYVDPLDSKAIAEAINTLMLDDTRMKTMAQVAQKAVEEKFNWSKEVQTLYRVYDEVTG